MDGILLIRNAERNGLPVDLRLTDGLIDEIADQFTGKVKVGKLDTDGNRSVSTEYGISSIPTLLLFQNGDIVEKFVGLKSKKDLSAALDRLVSV